MQFEIFPSTALSIFIRCIRISAVTHQNGTVGIVLVTQVCKITSPSSSCLSHVFRLGGSPNCLLTMKDAHFFFFDLWSFLKHDRLLSIDFLWFEKFYNHQRQYWEKSIETPPLLSAPWNEAENFKNIYAVFRTEILPWYRDTSSVKIPSPSYFFLWLLMKIEPTVVVALQKRKGFKTETLNWKRKQFDTENKSKTPTTTTKCAEDIKEDGPIWPFIF